MINKAAKAEDEEYTKVQYETVKAEGSEYEFSIKHKKEILKIEALGEEHSEYFVLERPPKEKKKKS